MATHREQSRAGAAAAAAVTGTPKQKLAAHATHLADVLANDDYCTDALWSTKLTYLQAYIATVLEDVSG